MAELSYLDLNLDLNLALKAIEDGKRAYLDSKKVYKKFDENKWLDAYNKIMSSGGITKVTLGTDDNGKYGYIVHHNGPVYDDPEGYFGDVAYYMLTTLSGLPPIKKEEPKPLPVFDAKQFRSDFGKHLAKKHYAGDSDFAASKWNDLDAPDKYGIRKTDNRKNRLIQALQTYKESLQDGVYSFEGSPFENLDDVRSRIDNAIAKLNTPDPNDDEDALNALGWSKSDWLETGENKPVMVGDKLMTALEARNYLENAQKEGQKLKLLAIKDSQYKKYKFIDATKFNGTPPTGENVLGELNTYSSLGKLNGDLMSRLVGAFKFSEKNNALSPLSKEELQAFGSFLGADRLRKINGLNGFYWDPAGKRIVQPFMSVNDGTVLDFLGLVNLNDPRLLKEQAIQKANLRKLSEDFKTEDFLRMGAMAQDIGGAVAAWVPGYGTAASGILGGTSLVTNLAADAMDDSLTKMDVAKNVGMNLMLAGVGMVPGLGLASKSGKWITNIAKWAPRLLTLQAIRDLPDSYNSLQKAITKPNELTNADWKNIAYGLSVVAGLSRGAAGFANNRKFKPAFTGNSEKQYTITTSKGKKTITKELVDKIKKLDPKDKEKYASEVKKALGLAEDETIDLKNLSIFGKEINKRIKIKEENVSTELSPKAKMYREYLENKNDETKLKHTFLSKIMPTDYDIYKAAANKSAPNLNIINRVKEAWNPLSDKNLLKKGMEINTLSGVNYQGKLDNNTAIMLKNAFEPPTSKISRSTKAPVINFKSKESTIDGKLIDGSNYLVKYSKNPSTKSDEMFLTINGKTSKVEGKSLHEMKLNLGKMLKEVNMKIQSTGSSYIKTNDLKWKDFVKSILELKRKGFLFKLGGLINDTDTIIENFLK